MACCLVVIWIETRPVINPGICVLINPTLSQFHEASGVTQTASLWGGTLQIHQAPHKQLTQLVTLAWRSTSFLTIFPSAHFSLVLTSPGGDNSSHRFHSGRDIKSPYISASSENWTVTNSFRDLPSLLSENHWIRQCRMPFSPSACATHQLSNLNISPQFIQLKISESASSGIKITVTLQKTFLLTFPG